MKTRLLACLLVCGGASCGDSGADGQIDAGGSVDGAAVAVDASPEPAPAPELAVTCADTVEDVYTTPGGLPAFTPAERGRIVVCSPGEPATAAQVATLLNAVTDVQITSGYTSYRIAYRTERAAGVEGIGTARMYLPDNPAPGPLPIVVATHGTAGLHDECAPSRHDEVQSQAELTLPWVAAGYPVIAPDYAGLGNDGIQGYINKLDTAHSVLDSARALLSAVTPGSVDGRVILAGHSQGGGAALAGQVYGRSYGGPDLNVVAVVSFAGGFEIASFAETFTHPFTPISGGQGIFRSVIALRLYADFANLFGQQRARDGLHADIRDYVGDAIDSQCVFALTVTLATDDVGYTAPRFLHQLVDETFRGDLAACLDDASVCTDDAMAFVTRASENLVPADVLGGPVLLLTGEDDAQRSPRNQACLRDQLQNDGLDPAACLLADKDHFDIVPAAIGYAVDWALATANGSAPPPCPAGPEFPSCN